ncbi:MAG: hypothetical protein IPN29_15430 [Saprospiraceae bacterium]|nr:hypothetical protein [Saprospiraceae bacterium]
MNGKFERQLTVEEFKKLKDSFKKAKLFDMDDEYPTMVADLPSISLLQTKKGKTKCVRGNEKMPDAWEHSADLMQEIYKNGEWKLLEKYPDDAPNPRTQKEDANIYEEIIIEPVAGVSLPQWFRTMAPYGIRLINRISADLNLWLITYDLDHNEPKLMLDIIKNDPAIKSAEFNKRIEPRDH